MIKRRALLVSALASLAILKKAYAQDLPKGRVLPLWQDAPPGGGGPQGPVQIGKNGRVFNIATPNITLFEPENDMMRRMTVLIAGGGGYRHIEIGKEAMPAVAWCLARGIACAVLTYRLPGEGWVSGPDAPLDDARQAMLLLRNLRQQQGAEQHKIGCLGFSAGGHLMGMLATRANNPIIRPDFAVLAYPIITLQSPYDHSATRVSLIGHHPSRQIAEKYSVETGVSPQTPRIFLAHAKDDPISPFQNALIMQQACLKAGVSVSLNLYAQGLHGFAMGEGSKEPVNWTPALENWL